MSWKKKILIFAGALFVLLLIAAAAGLWYVDRQYGAVFAAARANHLQLTERKAIVRLVVDPSKASAQLQSVINDLAPRNVPGWLIESFLPYEFSVIIDADSDDEKIYIDTLLAERRLGPLMVAQLNMAKVTDRFPEIAWAEAGFVLRERGQLALLGEVPMDPAAKEEAWMRWGSALVQSPPKLEGGHFIEAVADNREGKAWLIMASLMKAYDYNLDEHAKEVADGVSLASFMFLTEIRMVVDLVGADSARLRLTMDVIPEHRHKLAVINVKAFLDDVFENLSTNFEQYHQIPFEGESRWEEARLIFEYELGGVRETLELIANGNLFTGERQLPVETPPTSASAPPGRD